MRLEMASPGEPALSSVSGRGTETESANPTKAASGEAVASESVQTEFHRLLPTCPPSALTRRRNCYPRRYPERATNSTRLGPRLPAHAAPTAKKLADVRTCRPTDAGKRKTTADTALRLSQYLGMSADFWMNLKRVYELNRSACRAARPLSASRAQKEPVPQEGRPKKAPKEDGLAMSQVACSEFRTDKRYFESYV